ncbi:MAG: hypothetical protein F6K08_09440 [Okeania sp. SIO1H6]|uniref:hypothetical protein n=1 Tax=Okeania sp. SIO1F9 TaxID=2607813 RepID=UPI0013C80EC5|nr:hypothetical protein [Okeania sp. SIO1F9]NET13055.1 hypothetical protein [Okeania sp. SIO1H6]NET74811.1 hypothetical protein [Okeania sp. SIO1F9]
MKFCQKSPLLNKRQISPFSEHDKQGQRFFLGKFCEILPKIFTTEKETNFWVIRENLPLINYRYFQNMTHSVRDFFWGNSVKFCPKSLLLKRAKNFSLIRENLPLINSRYFQNMTHSVRDFFWGNSVKFCQKSPLLKRRLISPSSGKICH